jgi:hypothetical protein
VPRATAAGEGISSAKRRVRGPLAIRAGLGNGAAPRLRLEFQLRPDQRVVRRPVVAPAGRHDAQAAHE